MPKLKVYRVERPDTRRGPYIGSFEGSRYAVPGLERHDDDKYGHPTLHWGMDAIVRGSPDDFVHERYGFVSGCQLKAWFDPKERALLSAAGWVVGEYHVPRRGVAEYGKQALFDMELAHRVCDLDPSTLKRVA